MNLTAVVKTTTRVEEVKTTEVKHGEVLAASGRTVIVRSAEGTKKYTVPGDFPFWVNGEKKTVYDLKKGMNVTAHIVHTHVETVTERDAQVAASEPANAKPAAAPRQAAKPATLMLPKTGSSLPLLGLLGMLMLAISVGIGIIRRI
jgi:LPXTG-motif cell wall-anchored protein